jgi:hypothetical protein
MLYILAFLDVFFTSPQHLRRPTAYIPAYLVQVARTFRIC